MPYSTCASTGVPYSGFQADLGPLTAMLLLSNSQADSGSQGFTTAKHIHCDAICTVNASSEVDWIMTDGQIHC